MGRGLHAAGRADILCRAYRLWINPKKKPMLMMKSTLICPHCGHAATQVMPTDACLFYYQCAQCSTLLRPKPGDCCVFCSWGDVPCPPIQAQRNEGNADGNCCP
jgi:hypothetical protein